jgi:hypothetical protein
MWNMVHRTFQGRAMLAALVVTFGMGQLSAQDKPDKNSVELIVRGCLKGREVTADDISGRDDLANEVGMIFRLSAKGDLSDEIKRRNGQRVMVTGLVKKTALAKPGLQLGGGRVVIGGGPVAQDPTRNPARNPSRRMVPMDASAIEVVAESCRSTGPALD